MPNKICFIGHRMFLPDGLAEKLTEVVEQAIQDGCRHFIMGAHGDFDQMALMVCRRLKVKYPIIKIEQVLTNLPRPTENIVRRNQDIETIMYEIETLHPKQRIWASNQRMIESCDTMICYAVSDWHLTNGTHKACKYAQKCGLTIINLAEMI